MDADDWVTAFIRGIAAMPPSRGVRHYGRRPLHTALTPAQRRLLGFLKHLVAEGKVNEK